MKQLKPHQMALIAGGAGETSNGDDGSNMVSLGQATGAATAAGAIGAGVGASFAIEAAGGLSAMGAAAIPAGTAFGAGVVASGFVGWNIGTALYENSTTVQDGAQALVGFVLDVVDALTPEGDAFSGIGDNSCTYPDGIPAVSQLP